MRILLDLILWLATMGAMRWITSGDDDSSSGSTHESCESIRVYPSERLAVRYYDGKREEHRY